MPQKYIHLSQMHPKTDSEFNATLDCVRSLISVRDKQAGEIHAPNKTPLASGVLRVLPSMCILPLVCLLPKLGSTSSQMPHGGFNNNYYCWFSTFLREVLL